MHLILGPMKALVDGAEGVVKRANGHGRAQAAFTLLNDRVASARHHWDGVHLWRACNNSGFKDRQYLKCTEYGPLCTLLAIYVADRPDILPDDDLRKAFVDMACASALLDVLCNRRDTLSAADITWIEALGARVLRVSAKLFGEGRKTKLHYIAKHLAKQSTSSARRPTCRARGARRSTRASTRRSSTPTSAARWIWPSSSG